MELQIRDEFIKLGQALKLCGAASTGVDAKFMIESGEILVNGQAELRRGRKLYNGDSFVADGNEYTVKAGK